MEAKTILNPDQAPQASVPPSKKIRMCLSLTQDDYDLIGHRFGRANIADVLVGLAKGGSACSALEKETRTRRARRVASISTWLSALSSFGQTELTLENNIRFQAALVEINRELKELL